MNIRMLRSGLNSAFKTFFNWLLSLLCIQGLFPQPQTVSDSKDVESSETYCLNSPACVTTSLPSHVSVTNKDTNHDSTHADTCLETLNDQRLPEKAVEVSIKVDNSRHDETLVSNPNPEIRASSHSPQELVGHNFEERPRPYVVSPIVQLLRDQELGKAVLGFIAPLMMAFLQNQAQAHAKGSSFSTFDMISISLCVGLAGVWNGILLRNDFPRVANTVEQLGVSFIFLSFFGILGSFVPPAIDWVVWVCFGLSLFPFIFSHLPMGEKPPVH